MLDKSKKRKLRDLLAKISPEDKTGLLIDNLRDDLNENKPFDYSKDIVDLRKSLLKIYENIINKIDTLPTNESVGEIKKNYLENIDEIKLEIENITKEIDSLKSEEEDEYVENEDIKKDFEDFKKDIIQKLNNRGGGSMPRKITLNGTDVFTKYADYNLINIGASASNNETTKAVDITLAGGSDVDVWKTTGSGGYDIAVNATSTQKFLSQTSSGTPSWQTVPTSGNFTYYLTNVNSANPASDYKQIITPQAGKVTLSYTGITSTPALLKTWITDAGNPNLTFIPAGQFEFHIHLSNSTAGRLSAYGEIWEVDSSGADVGKIGTSETTYQESGAYIPNTEIEYRLFFSTANVYNLANSSSRIALKLYCVGVSGTHTLEVYVGGTADSHIALPSNTVDATNFVPYTGATQNVNLGTKTLTAKTLNSTDLTASKAVFTDASKNLTSTGIGTSAQFIKGDGSLDSTLYTPTSRTLTINGTTQDLSTDRSWTVTASVTGESLLAQNVVLDTKSGTAVLAYNSTPSGKRTIITRFVFKEYTATAITLGGRVSAGKNSTDYNDVMADTEIPLIGNSTDTCVTWNVEEKNKALLNTESLYLKVNTLATGTAQSLKVNVYGIEEIL